MDISLYTFLVAQTKVFVTYPQTFYLLRVHAQVRPAFLAPLLPSDCLCKLITDPIKEDFQGYMGQACVLTESFCIFWNHWFGPFLKNP